MIKNPLLDYLAHRLGVIWLVVFLYIITAGLFIQLILLLHMFPSWHAENGLFRGMDGLKFHRAALDLSVRIQENGWGAWELRPEGQSVSGIAAICYVLIYPAPWSVLPVIAAVNSTAAVYFILMLEKLNLDRQRSVLAALPFVFFPSALLWNAQFHNDNYAVPGMVLILYGWSLLAARQTENLNRIQIPAVLLIGAGSILLGMVRMNILYGVMYLFLFVCLMFGFFSLGSVLLRKLTLSSFLVKMLNLTLGIIVMAAITLAGYKPLQDSLFGVAAIQDTASVPGDDGIKSKSASDVRKWENSDWLPRMVDEELKDIAKIRREFLKKWSRDGSVIDSNIAFSKAGDIAAYLPRGLQIGLFSPFPEMWFTEGNKAFGSALRAGTAFEMSIAYFCLLGLPYFAWSRRKQPAVWVVIFVCMAMLLLYAITIPNLGALYRFRYPYYMPLVCMGLGGWLTLESRKIPAMFSRKPGSVATSGPEDADKFTNSAGPAAGENAF